MKDNDKRKQLLAKGKTLFWKYGIRRVSVEEICREASVSKMTFYRYFPNKIELAKTIFQVVADENMAKYRQIMAQDLPFSLKTKEILLLKLEGSKKISQEFLMDLYKHPELAPFLQKQQEKSHQEILKNFELAIAHGEIRQGIQLNRITYYLAKIQEMMMDENYLALFDNPQEAIFELTSFFFYGIGVQNQEDRA